MYCLYPFSFNTLISFLMLFKLFVLFKLNAHYKLFHLIIFLFCFVFFTFFVFFLCFLIDEQNSSLNQHKSTFVVIDYYQGFKPPFLRLILREFKGKKPRSIWVDYTSPEFKMAPTPLTRSGFQ